jgi:hypothetical protein
MRGPSPGEHGIPGLTSLKAKCILSALIRINGAFSALAWRAEQARRLFLYVRSPVFGHELSFRCTHARVKPVRHGHESRPVAPLPQQR